MAVDVRRQMPRIIGVSFVAALLAGTAGAAGAHAAPQTGKAAPSVVRHAHQVNLVQDDGDAGHRGHGNASIPGLNHGYGDVGEGGSGGDPLIGLPGGEGGSGGDPRIGLPAGGNPSSNGKHGGRSWKDLVKPHSVLPEWRPTVPVLVG